MSRWICGTPIDSFIILQLEQQMEISFPDDYKSIIMEHNGGSPVQQTFNIVGKEGLEFNALLEISSDESNEFINAQHAISFHRNHKLIPFANDSFGNYLCFNYSVDGAPSIVFWEHDSNKLYDVAENFSELIQKLY